MEPTRKPLPPSDVRPPPGQAPLEDGDVFEETMRRALAWLSAHLAAIGWGAVAIAVAVVVVAGWWRANERREREAWKQLGGLGGPQVGSIERTRKLVDDYGATSAGPFLRHALAAALFARAQSIDNDRPNRPENWEEKLAALDEASTLCESLKVAWANTPQADELNVMAAEIGKERAFVRAHGVRFVRRTVAPKAGKDLGKCVAAPEKPQVAIVTPYGEITVELLEDDAPNTVASFLALVAEGFYDGLTFHRVEAEDPAPLIHGGDPKGDGTGGPGYRLWTEIPPRVPFAMGAVAMHNAGRNSEGSQFFILKGEPSAGVKEGGSERHTIFGKVLAGLEVAQKIHPPDKISEIRILQRRGTAADFPYRPIVVYPTPSGPPPKS